MLYKSNSDEPIAIIEAKRPDENINKALKQGIGYAESLGVKLVFATDGTITETYHTGIKAGLERDDLPIIELLSEKELQKLVETGKVEVPKEVQYTRKELIKIFERANELLRKDGLSEGKERFTEFANLLFMKMISEIEDDREKHGVERRFEKRYCWDYFKNYDGQRMLEYVNDTILPKLINKYNGSGDVFPKTLNIKPKTLKEIVDKLSTLNMLSIDTDVKGDAFEYFLKQSISVGDDLGEYFTPRHIVKLIVKLVDPKFGDTIYDPCCGTGGFLIESYKNIWTKCKHTEQNILKLQEETIYGRELTGTAKIAKMNMILAGDGHTNIEQIDSLEKPVKDTFDAVVTNFPFAQETDYSGLYGFDTKDANPIFLKHIVDALKDEGRAGVVVFQGILYDDVQSYTKIRKILLETCNVEAVIKLHNYVFRPYAGANTSILILSKGKPTKKVWFFNVENDGFEKTGSIKGRPPIDANDLPLLMELWQEKGISEKSWVVDIDTIRANNYNLNAETYKPKKNDSTSKQLVPILSVITPIKTTVKSFDGERAYLKTGDLDNDRITNLEYVTFQNKPTRANLEVEEEDVIFAKMKNTNKSLLINPKNKNMIISTGFFVLRSKDRNKLLPEFLKYIVSSDRFLEQKDEFAHGSTQEAINESEDLKQLKIPLPSIEKQREIVNDLNLKKEKIDNINELLISYSKNLIEQSVFASDKSDLLGNLLEDDPQNGIYKSKEFYGKGTPIIRIDNIYDCQFVSKNMKLISLTQKELETYNLNNGDIVLNRVNSEDYIGKCCLYNGEFPNCVFESNMMRFRTNKKANPKYVIYYLSSNEGTEQIKSKMKRAVNQVSVNQEDIKSIRIPILSLEKQEEIATKIDLQMSTIINLKEIRDTLKMQIELELSKIYK